MTTVNPFSDDPEKAEIFELGYLAGFQDPNGTDLFRPLAPELLDIFVEGTEAGRQNAAQPPSADPGKTWVSKSELNSEAEEIPEAIEHLAIEGIAELTAHVFHRAAFGLAGVVVTVLGIQGNVSPEQLEPLPDDFSQPYGGPDGENVFYVPCCPRPDHPQVQLGVSSEGYWTGAPSNDFGAALKDAAAQSSRPKWRRHTR